MRPEPVSPGRSLLAELKAALGGLLACSFPPSRLRPASSQAQQENSNVYASNCFKENKAQRSRFVAIWGPPASHTPQNCTSICGPLMRAQVTAAALGCSDPDAPALL